MIDWHEALAVTTDPAHIIAELVFTLVFDGLVLGIGWRYLKRYLDGRLKREHQVLDEEHGQPHPDLAYDSRKPLTAEQRRRALDPFVKAQYIEKQQRAKQDES